MDAQKTGLHITVENEIDGHYEAEFWHKDVKYEVGVLENDDEVMLILEGADAEKHVETIEGYSIVEEQGKETISPYQLEESYRTIRTSTKPVEITEENKKREIEAYIIKALRPDGISSDTTASDILHK